MKAYIDTKTGAYRLIADDGEVAGTHGAAHAIHRVACFIGDRPDIVVPTAAQWVVLDAQAKADAAARALPDGWETTLDGATVTICGPAQSFTKPFRRIADGAICEASVADREGTTTPDTVAALCAYDAEHPLSTEAPPEA